MCAYDRISLNFVLDVVRRSCADQFLYSVETDEEKQQPISPNENWLALLGYLKSEEREHKFISQDFDEGKFVVFFSFLKIHQRRWRVEYFKMFLKKQKKTQYHCKFTINCFMWMYWEKWNDLVQILNHRTIVETHDTSRYVTTAQLSCIPYK